MESENLFNCRASQLYESLPDLASNQDGADEFFDVPSTPVRNDSSQQDEFFTPLREEVVGALSVNRARPGLSPVAENSRDEAEMAEDIAKIDSAERRKSGSDLPLGRVILKARRRSWDIPKVIISEPSTSAATWVVKDDVEQLTRRVFEGIQLEAPLEKRHPMTTRHDTVIKTPTLTLRSRNVVRHEIKRKRLPSPPCSKQQHPPTKYVALAEQIQHFFEDTPPRFRRTRPVDLQDSLQDKVERLQVTMPQSPCLLTKERRRLSPVPEERGQIKAKPVNRRVFQPPVRPSAKPATVPKPFKLTEVPKKAVNEPEKTKSPFKARPVPRASRSSMSSLSSLFSNSSSLNIVRVPAGELKNIDNAHQGVTNANRNNHTIQVRPFSFDVRNKIAQLEKQKKIEAAIKEASKVPKFTARPLPAYLSTSVSESGSSSYRRVQEHSSDEKVFVFKANPADVLLKEPFVPKKTDKPLTDVTDFELNTERRARERAVYEQSRKEKELVLEQTKKELAAEREKLDHQELIQLRKSRTTKALPLPPI